jgi:hypothetical protein
MKHDIEQLIRYVEYGTLEEFINKNNLSVDSVVVDVVNYYEKILENICCEEEEL